MAIKNIFTASNWTFGQTPRGCLESAVLVFQYEADIHEFSETPGQENMRSFLLRSTAFWISGLKFNIPVSYSYQLLHQYHKILAACNIQRRQACEHKAIILWHAKLFCWTTQLFYRAKIEIGRVRDTFCRKLCGVALRYLFLRIKVKLYLFSVFFVFLTISLSVQYRKVLHTCVTMILYGNIF